MNDSQRKIFYLHSTKLVSELVYRCFFNEVYILRFYMISLENTEMMVTCISIKNLC